MSQTRRRNISRGEGRLQYIRLAGEGDKTEGKRDFARLAGGKYNRG